MKFKRVLIILFFFLFISFDIFACDVSGEVDSLGIGNCCRTNISDPFNHYQEDIVDVFYLGPVSGYNSYKVFYTCDGVSKNYTFSASTSGYYRVYIGVLPFSTSQYSSCVGLLGCSSKTQFPTVFAVTSGLSCGGVHRIERVLSPSGVDIPLIPIVPDSNNNSGEFGEGDTKLKYMTYIVQDGKIINSPSGFYNWKNGSSNFDFIIELEGKNIKQNLTTFLSNEKGYVHKTSFWDFLDKRDYPIVSFLSNDKATVRFTNISNKSEYLKMKLDYYTRDNNTFPLGNGLFVQGSGITPVVSKTLYFFPQDEPVTPDKLPPENKPIDIPNDYKPPTGDNTVITPTTPEDIEKTLRIYDDKDLGIFHENTDNDGIYTYMNKGDKISFKGVDMGKFIISGKATQDLQFRVWRDGRVYYNSDTGITPMAVTGDNINREIKVNGQNLNYDLILEIIQGALDLDKIKTDGVIPENPLNNGDGDLIPPIVKPEGPQEVVDMTLIELVRQGFNSILKILLLPVEMLKKAIDLFIDFFNSITGMLNVVPMLGEVFGFLPKEVQSLISFTIVSGLVVTLWNFLRGLK